MFAPLADQTFRRLFAAQVTSLAGTGLATVALALLVYDLAGGDAGLVLGMMLALKMVIYVVLAPLIGAVVQRLPRRRVLVTLDLARAGIVLGLPFATEIWQVYVLFLALHVCAAGFTPIFQATIPDVLKDEGTYTQALSLSRLAYDIENLASPSLAAAALLIFSYDALFAANAVTFIASALLVALCRLPQPTRDAQEKPFLDRVTAGTRIYLATPRLRGLFALSLSVAAAGSMAIVNTVVLVRDRLGGSDSDVAILMAAVGAGSMVGAIVLPRILGRVSDRSVMIAGALLLSATMLGGPVAESFPSLAVLWALLGLGTAVVMTPSGRLLRRSATARDRPAVFTAQFAFSHACWLVAYPTAGLLGRLPDTAIAFGGLAALTIAGTLAALWLWPAEDAEVLEHDHPELNHDHLHVHDEHHQHEHEGWEGPEPHSHPHRHGPLRHRHAFVIDDHHPTWPRG